MCMDCRYYDGINCTRESGELEDIMSRPELQRDYTDTCEQEEPT